MSAQSAVRDCTHIKITGVRCGSPALRGEQFCYFHQHAHRGVRKPPQSRLHPIAILENEESIQASLMEVINALMRNTIDLKRAELILRALHIAVKNARRAKFESNASQVVREVPAYAPPKPVDSDQDETPAAGSEYPPEPELDIPYTAAIPPQDYKELAAERLRAAKLQAERTHREAVRAALTRAGQGVIIGPANPPPPAVAHSFTGFPANTPPPQNSASSNYSNVRTNVPATRKPSGNVPAKAAEAKARA